MNTRKRLISTVVALTLPLVSMASHNGNHFDHGFYVGGAAGVSRLTADIDQTVFGSSAVAEAELFTYFVGDFDASSDATTDRGMGQIQAGYAIAWEWLFVGLEVSVNGSQLSADHYHSATSELYSSNPTAFNGFVRLTPTINSHTNIELNNFEPVADLKLGFTLPTRTHLYARVGAAFNTIELHETVSFDQFFFVPVEPHLKPRLYSQYFRVSESESVVGFRIGAGIEHRFFDRVSVALDYVHTDYDDVSLSQFEDSIIPFKAGVHDDMFQYGASDDVDLTRDVVTLGMNYYF